MINSGAMTIAHDGELINGGGTAVFENPGTLRKTSTGTVMFNTVVFNSRVTQLQLVSPTDQTVRNPQFLADGTLDQSRVQPRNAGFGAVTGANPMRSVQATLRFSF